MEMVCFISGLFLGVAAGLFCMGLMKVSADSEISARNLYKQETR